MTTKNDWPERAPAFFTSCFSLGLRAAVAGRLGRQFTCGPSGLHQGKLIKIGQIGVCHEHASGKIDTLKKWSEVFEIVGVVDDRKSTAANLAGTDLKCIKV
jgi:hypothetical protein